MITTTPTSIHYLLVILEYGNLKHEGSHQLLVEILQRNDNPAGWLVKFNNLSKKQSKLKDLHYVVSSCFVILNEPQHSKIFKNAL
jgi:hypothetical protein